jgi:hypothetical protein
MITQLLTGKFVQGTDIKAEFRTTCQGGTSSEIFEALTDLQKEAKRKNAPSYDLNVYSLQDLADRFNKYGYDAEEAEAAIKVNGWRAGTDGLTICSDGQKKVILCIESNQFQVW